MAVKFYQVQPGDNLTRIGEMFGVPWQEIAKQNKLGDPNRIQPNEVLMIPQPDLEEDRLRVQAAQAEPAAQQVIQGRPSQQPQSIGFDVVDRPRAAPPTQAQLPPRAAELVQGPQPQGVGTGSLENVKSKSYPPHDPSQLAYPEFWADFLNNALPTAVQGMSGPGAALVRGAVGLARMENPFAGEPSAARADFARRAGRHFQRYPNEPRDPNYGDVFQPEASLPMPKSSAAEQADWRFYRRYPNEASAPKPFPRKQRTPSEPTMDVPASRAFDPNGGMEGMTLGDFIGQAVSHVLRKLILPGADDLTQVGGTEGTLAGVRQFNFGAQARPQNQYAQHNADEIAATYGGPGSSHAKNVFPNTTTVERQRPFAEVIRQGMARGKRKAGDMPPPGGRRAGEVQYAMADWYRDRRQSQNVEDYRTYDYPYAPTPVAGPEPADTVSVYPPRIFALPQSMYDGTWVPPELDTEQYRNTLDFKRKQRDQQDIDWEELKKKEPEIYKAADVIPFPGKRGMGNEAPLSEGARPNYGGGGRGEVVPYRSRVMNPKMTDQQKYERAVRDQQQGGVKEPEFELLGPGFIQNEIPHFQKNPMAYLAELQAMTERTPTGTAMRADSEKLLNYFYDLYRTMR